MEHWAAAGAGAEPQGSCEPHSPLGREEPSCNLTPDFFQSAPLLDLPGMIRELNGGFSPLPTNKINVVSLPGPLGLRDAGTMSSAFPGSLSLPPAVIMQTTRLSSDLNEVSLASVGANAVNLEKASLFFLFCCSFWQLFTGIWVYWLRTEPCVQSELKRRSRRKEQSN